MAGIGICVWVFISLRDEDPKIKKERIARAVEEYFENMNKLSDDEEYIQQRLGQMSNVNELREENRRMRKYIKKYKL